MIAPKRRDQTAGVCMAVDRRYGWPRIGEEAQIDGAISIEPRLDLFQRAAREQRKGVVKVEARREHGAGAGENHSIVAKLSFEAIECGVKVSEEDRILCVDFVRVHRHDDDMVMLALDGPRH